MKPVSLAALLAEERTYSVEISGDIKEKLHPGEAVARRSGLQKGKCPKIMESVRLECAVKTFFDWIICNELASESGKLYNQNR